MGEGEAGMFLIVPEQYSHYAERQLCAVCGDKAALHAETLSFTRLYSNVMAETAMTSIDVLDASGQILALYRALESTAPWLKVYGVKKMRTEILENLLDTIKEFKSLNITAQSLEHISSKASNPTADKLKDIALILDAYNAILHVHGGDAADRMTLLAEYIGDSTVGSSGHVFFDGFNDFTVQELCVIKELLLKKASITVCLTCDPDDSNEIFEVPNRTFKQLKRFADESGVKVERIFMERDEPSPCLADEPLPCLPCLAIFNTKLYLSETPLIKSAPNSSTSFGSNCE